MKDALKQFISKFKAFNEEEIKAIVEAMQTGSFKKGTILLKESEICTKCYFVLSGCVRQYQLTEKGEEKTTAFFTENQAAVLYSSYMERRPSEYYLSCVEDCILTTGTREQELKLHKKYPKLEYLVHQLLPHDFSKTQKHLASMINHSPEERYRMLMNTQPELLNRAPLHQIASYIGVTPESFSRIRKRVLLKGKAKF